MRPDSLKFLLSWTNHRPAKRKISKPLVYDQVSSLGSPFALYDPVTVINPDAPKVDYPGASRSRLILSSIPVSISLVTSTSASWNTSLLAWSTNRPPVLISLV